MNIAQDIFGLPEARDKRGRLIIGVPFSSALDDLVGRTVTIRVTPPPNSRCTFPSPAFIKTNKQHEMIDCLRDALVGVRGGKFDDVVSHVLTHLYKNNLTIGEHVMFIRTSKGPDVIGLDEFGEFLVAMIRRAL